MPEPISEADLRKFFPGASKSTLKVNTAWVQSPEPERAVPDAPPPAVPAQAPNLRRFVVRITGYRRRLLDPDNFCGGAKYIIDGLRHAEVIPNDTPEHIRLETAQTKVSKVCEERVEVEIEEL